MTRLYLFDIEGTTTDIDFVHQVLFPYSAENLQNFILHHQTHPTVSSAITQVRDNVSIEQNRRIGLYEVIAQLLSWIKEDRKHPALKEIQGLIWESGYSQNHFKGHVYQDVEPFFKKIFSTKAKIGIYSSGSIHAQKLIFTHSISGDLTPLISCYYDTNVGPKREKASYEKLAKEAGLHPEDIHFFSDVIQELEAAQAAGMKVTHVVREQTQKSSFDCISTFQEMMERI